MKSLKTLTACAALALLAACGEDDSAENFVGRWVADRGNSIFQISDAGDGRVEIERTYIMLNRVKTEMLEGRIEDGQMIVGQAMFQKSFRYDSDTNRLVTADREYLAAPDGWTFRDSRHLLEG